MFSRSSQIHEGATYIHVHTSRAGTQLWTHFFDFFFNVIKFIMFVLSCLYLAMYVVKMNPTRDIEYPDRGTRYALLCMNKVRGLG
jgi:hypothetical protein